MCPILSVNYLCSVEEAQKEISTSLRRLEVFPGALFHWIQLVQEAEKLKLDNWRSVVLHSSTVPYAIIILLSSNFFSSLGTIFGEKLYHIYQWAVFKVVEATAFEVQGVWDKPASLAISFVDVGVGNILVAIWIVDKIVVD